MRIKNDPLVKGGQGRSDPDVCWSSVGVRVRVRPIAVGLESGAMKTKKLTDWVWAIRVDNPDSSYYLPTVSQQGYETPMLFETRDMARGHQRYHVDGRYYGRWRVVRVSVTER